MQKKNRFTFIDLFAGIGGFRIAAEEIGGKCVFSSEINGFSCDTYETNFGERPFGDIKKILSSEIPEHDILFGGFPCQSFSKVGKRKGFDDARGTLIWEIWRIVRDKRPKFFLLENVEGLLSIDGGKSFRTILEAFGNRINGKSYFFVSNDCLGYRVFWKVMNSGDFGLAQNRRRVFIVGVRNNVGEKISFRFPKTIDNSKRIYDILEDENRIGKKYYLTEDEIIKLKKKKNRTNLETTELNVQGKARTIIGDYGRVGAFSTLYLKGKSKTIILESMSEFKKKAKLVYGQMPYYVERNFKGIRMFTPRECARLQGFPETFKLHKNDARAYKQLGNAVPPPVVLEIIKILMSQERRKDTCKQNEKNY
ncbi:MAG: DNA (cytosine-5-)-methyltransferase [Elusimicrobiota bacterium]